MSDSEQDAVSAPDDSGDEDWEEDHEVEDLSEDETAHDDETQRDVSGAPLEFAPGFEDLVAQLISADECGECLRGKTAQLSNFLCSYGMLSRDERKASLMTALSILKEADTA